MKLYKIPLVILSISPVLSILRAYQAADARMKGLLTDEAAKRQLMTNVGFAAVVYLVLMGLCLFHLSKNTSIGGFRKTLWMMGIIIMPIIFIPSYFLFNFNS